MSAPAEMETALAADLVTADGRCWDYQVWLTWTACNPWAITMALPSVGGTAEWLFALDLLRAGLHSAAGIGDVRLIPGCVHGMPEVTQVEVRFGTDPDRCVSVYLDRESLTEFLDEISAHYADACNAARAEMAAEIVRLIDDPDGQWTAPGGEGH